MNWELATLISLGIFILLILCAIWAVVELTWHQRKEDKKWQTWVNEKRVK